ncbi:MAG: sugar phosphate isomerase/epimerase [Anaerolineae bacterium]|nr:sugar phosphate isomerase/epimerase [Anaerolineae bacterium]
MSRPIAVQLYSLRDALAQDFTGVIHQVAEMGYLGVETAGFPGISVADAGRLFQSVGLEVVAVHGGMPLGDNRPVLDTMATLGCSRLVVAYIPPEEFRTLDDVKRVCQRLNEANAVARERGLTLLYHNHWWEYGLVEGQYPYQVMLKELDPTVEFELDIYWAQTAGHDPAAVVRELGTRVPLLHIKDGPCVHNVPMTAAGDGVVNIPAVVEAAGNNAAWLIVELDQCATDVATAVRKSHDYMVNKGLAHGR